MNQNILYYGSAQPPPKKYFLKAGPLNLVYQNGFIRHIHIGEKEVVNMIYFALRDSNWGTYHGIIKNEKIKASAKGFDVSFRSVVSEQSIQYIFDCSIKGNADGRIEFVIKGESFANFKSNRIGFCILHSVNGYSGESCTIRHADKTETQGTFPDIAEPHQPYINIRSLLWEPAKGWEAEMKFDGDIFEMEDQRNWSDGTYKTYCTPLSIPYPAEVKIGDKIKQKVDLTVTAARKDAISKIKGAPAPELAVARGAPVQLLPGIGMSDTSQYISYSENDRKLLGALGLDHLRIELDLTEPGVESTLEKIAKKVASLELPLMIFLVSGSQPESEIAKFISAASGLNLKIDALILLARDLPSTPESLISSVSASLRTAFPNARIGGGTGQNFAELNRNRISSDLLDFITFPSSPQAHLIDNTIMIENLAGAAGALRSAQAFSSGKPVVISPISLRPRIRKKTSEFPLAPAIPPDIDPLQTSLFGAGWTLGSIRYLAESGAGRLTYFETTGWRGVVQGGTPSPMPSLFSANANASFPMYFVFYWLGKLKGAGVMPVESSDPLAVSGLALLKDKTKYLMIANHTESTLQLPVNNFKNGIIVSRLNEKHLTSFMNDPLAYIDKQKEEPFENSVSLMSFEILVMKSGK